MIVVVLNAFMLNNVMLNTIMLNNIMLNVVMGNVYDECHNAECHYAVCYYAECLIMMNDILQCRYAERHISQCSGSFNGTDIKLIMNQTIIKT